MRFLGENLKKKVKGRLRSPSRSTVEAGPQNSKSVPSAGQTVDRSNSLWNEALKSLSLDDQNVLSSYPKPSSKLELLQDMLNATTAKRDKYDNQRWKFTVGGREIVLRDQANKIISWLNRFKEVGDVAVNYDPVHAALPWAGLRFLLVVVVAESEAAVAFLVGIERMVNLIGRCTIYEKLYLNDENMLVLDDTQMQLQKTLLQLYVHILTFFCKANQFFTRGTLPRIGGAALSAGSDIQDYLNAIAAWEEPVHHDIANCQNKRNDLQNAQNAQNAQDLQELLRKWERVDFGLAALRDNLDESQRQHILTWVSKMEYERLHYTAQDHRIDNSGNWLLQHMDYVAWLESNESMILWLHGVPGAGKTKLVSAVVEDLLQYRSASSQYSSHLRGLAYFYCDRNRPDTRSAESVMNSILRQLATPKPGGPILHQVVELHHEKQKNAFASGHPTFEESSKVLLDLLPIYQQVLIVVDALDECEQQTRGKLMCTFRQLLDASYGGSINAKIFISSRRDADIVDQLKSAPNISIGATDNLEDISSFVTQNIQPLRISQGLRDEICETLVAKSEGVFQWAALQVSQVKDLCPYETGIRTYLGRLPKDLKAAYDNIYAQIQGQLELKKTIADRAFQWVSCSFRPLSPEELVAAACQNPASDETDSVEIDINFLLSACHNLLVVDTNSNICRFSHLSVQEYFETHRWDRSQMHLLAAKVCLKLFNDSNHWYKKIEELPTERRGILDYATLYWSDHLHECHSIDIDPQTVTLLKRFFGSLNESGPAYQTVYEWRRIGFYLHHHSGSFLASKRRPYYTAVALGLDRFLPDWCALDFGDINERDDLGNSLLMTAAQYGRLSIVKELIEKGADINISGGDYGSALGAAAYSGKKETVELLLDRGADINISGGGYGSALGAAAFSEQEEIVKLLLDRGADINISGDKYGSALGLAAYFGEKETVELLLDRGADINIRGGIYGSVLEAAACSGRKGKEIVELLLDRGADINVSGGIYGSVLGAAAFADQEEIVELLLDRGADINASGGIYGSVLGTAVYFGEKETVELLLDRGADIDTSGGNYGSVLGAAAYFGRKEIVELQLDRGADVNIPGGKYGSPLATARSGDNGSREEMLALLLERGAKHRKDRETIEEAEQMMKIVLDDCGHA